MNDFTEKPASKHSFAVRSLVHGIGVNDASYMVRAKDENGEYVTCPFYNIWMNMIKRCYSEVYQARRPTYKGCTVADEWLSFSNFKHWMEKQDWQGKQLDKDIKKIDNKIYSPENCLFVTTRINCLFNDCGSAQGIYPVGVSFHKSTQKFIARCSRNGKRIHLGVFSSPEEACKSYRAYKNKTVIEVANKPENTYLKEYLLKHAELFYDPPK